MGNDTSKPTPTHEFSMNPLYGHQSKVITTPDRSPDRSPISTPDNIDNIIDRLNYLKGDFIRDNMQNKEIYRLDNSVKNQISITETEHIIQSIDILIDKLRSTKDKTELKTWISRANALLSQKGGAYLRKLMKYELKLSEI